LPPWPHADVPLPGWQVKVEESQHPPLHAVEG
jgi:hypothetical protein